jgi:hypothetical protein
MDVYHIKGLTLAGKETRISLNSGPVIIDEDGKFLLHKADSTGKYQFTGGRLDDDFSLRANAKYRPAQDLGLAVRLVAGIDPLIIAGIIERDGAEEYTTLVHYLAEIDDRKQIRGDRQWFTLDEVRELDKKGETSSANVLLA